MIKRVTLKITGLVQGVGYRYVSSNKAKSWKLVGYVKNTADGGVEIVAEGEEDDLKNFIAWCYNGVGPAMVHNIDQSWSEATGVFDDFMIKF